jgi:hypothetical protein
MVKVEMISAHCGLITELVFCHVLSDLCLTVLLPSKDLRTIRFSVELIVTKHSTIRLNQGS